MATMKNYKGVIPSSDPWPIQDTNTPGGYGITSTLDVEFIEIVSLKVTDGVLSKAKKIIAFYDGDPSADDTFADFPKLSVLYSTTKIWVKTADAGTNTWLSSTLA